MSGNSTQRSGETKAPRRLAAALLAALAIALLLAPGAGATQYQRPFTEVLGSAEQQSFEWPQAIAVDHATGDVLVLDEKREGGGGNQEVLLYRFHADGTPAPFADLGANVIDGKGSGHGPGSGGSCVPVSLECDETPRNELAVGRGVHIAIDESGGPTNGDIYVTQYVEFSGPKIHAVYAFSDAGRYLGQIGSGSAGPFKPRSTDPVRP